MELHETDDGLFCFLDEPEFSVLWYAFFRTKEAAEAAYLASRKANAELKAERDTNSLLLAEILTLRQEKERFLAAVDAAMKEGRT